METLCFTESSTQAATDNTVKSCFSVKPGLVTKPVIESCSSAVVVSPVWPTIACPVLYVIEWYLSMNHGKSGLVCHT